MSWSALQVATTTEAIEAVSNLLMEAGASGIQVEDATDFIDIDNEALAREGKILDLATVPHLTSGAQVTGYFPPNVNVTEIQLELTPRIQGLSEFGLNPGSGEITVKQVDEADWATEWQKYYHPVRVTHELTIVPRWEEYTPVNDQEKVIYMDPGMAFGTGTHPTTKLMLQALAIALRGGEHMIDVGTGSGILSIAAKHLGAGVVEAYDIDQVAVDSAQTNLDLNPIAKEVKLGVNSLLDGMDTQVDLVVANILAEVLVPLIPQAFMNLKPGGKFLLSGIIADKFALISQTLLDHGFKVDQTMRMGDWYGIIAHKPANDED